MPRASRLHGRRVTIGACVSTRDRPTFTRAELVYETLGGIVRVVKFSAAPVTISLGIHLMLILMLRARHTDAKRFVWI